MVHDAEDYLDHVLELWRANLQDVSNEQLETPEFPSQWQIRYHIDAMLKHAVMRPIRHAFQLDELMKGRRGKLVSFASPEEHLEIVISGKGLECNP